jgi:predicted nucleic acid-binding protein
MERFRQLSRHSMKIGTRTLDVMHVACACEIQADTFISFDDRQCALAKLAGLKVLEQISD